MEVVKIFNNNVALALDEGNREIIVMGRGLGFQKKPGDKLDISLVEKRFNLADQNFKTAISELYHDMPAQEIDLLLTIIQRAKDSLGRDYGENLYLALADHLHYMIDRARQGIHFKHPLLWEVKRLYPQEYQLGLEATRLLNEHLNLSVLEDEAVSIALHFINAQKEGQQLEVTVKVTQLMQELLNIVRRFYAKEFDDDSMSYARFLTHLQYFAQRVVSGTLQEPSESLLFEQVKTTYPKAFSCAQIMERYVAQHYHFEVGDDELVYLIIHIHRSTQ